jgi:hypothetical protein
MAMLRGTLALSLLFLALPAAAQTGLGTVKGTVTDATKAVIPHAKVSLTNTATGVTQTNETNSAGTYYFASVQIGPYTLAIEMTGFKKWSGTLSVEAGQTVTVDPTMEVGSLEATIEVTGVAPVISTEGAQVSDIKDSLRIHELPLNGRQITNLFDLTPGVEGGGAPRTNGMKVGSTEMLLDGISLVDRYGGGMARVQPGLDTIQEFRVETAGSDAQYDRPATVSLVTKSGTNDFHGAAFETFRNNFGGLRARQIQDSGGTPPEYIRNEFGASAGGRIIKNKTFWYFSYEGMRLRQQVFARTQQPTDAIWGGDFSGAVDQNGNKFTIYDPLSTKADGTRLPFAGNIIPTDRIAPIAAVMKSVSALPTDPSANPWLVPNFQTYYPNIQDTNSITAKIDQVFSDKDSLSGRFTRSTSPSSQNGGRFGYPPPGCPNCGGTASRNYAVHSIFVRENHVFTPTFLNEFQASANRSKGDYGTLADNVNWADKLGFPNPFGVTGWPTIYTSDSQFFYGGGWDSDNRHNQDLTQFQIEDNVTWIKGKHSMKFGFKGRQEYNNIRELQQAQGSHSFYADWTSLYDPANKQAVSYTGDGLASLELGLPTYLSNQYNRGFYYFQQKEFGTYFQDTWRVNSRLTLNLGLRWDMWTPYHEKYNRLVNLDPAALAPTGMQVITPHNTALSSIPGLPPSVVASWAARGLTSVTADQAGFPGALIPQQNHDFGPRLGVAYRVTDKFVLRGGYGIYYWTMPLSQILQTSRTNPPLNLRFQNDLTNQNGAHFNYALSVVPAATDFIGQATVDVNGIVPLPSTSQTFFALDPNNWADDRVHEWTFVIERQMMKDTALRFSYIGNHGSNLEQRWGWNDPTALYNYRATTGLAGDPGNPDPRRINPNWNGAYVAHNGYSNSQGFQAEVERRYSSGLAFQAFYTYTHALTTSDAGGSTSGNGNINGAGAGSVFQVPESLLLFGNPQLTPSQLLRLGYANTDSVPPHHVRWNGVYDLPFGKGKKFGNTASGVLNQVIGGWQLAFIGEWRSGFWMGVNSKDRLFANPTLSKDQRITVNIFGRQQQVYFRGDFDPTQATGPNVSQLEQLVPVDRSQRVLRPLGSNFDNRLPQTLADGTVVDTSITDIVTWNARDFFQGPGSWNEDMSAFKNFTFKERYKLRLTGDFFNLFNHPNNVNPDSTTGLMDLSVQANDPRIIQFSARVEW